MNKRRRITLTLVVAVIGSAIGFYLYSTQSLIPRSDYQDDLDAFMQTHNFADGDLVLRRGKSFESFAVLMSDREGEYSHIGLIRMEDSIPWVLHASPENGNAQVTPILFEPLKSFLDYDKAREYAHYALAKDYIVIGQHAVDEAKQMYLEQRPFDHNYDLDEDSALYCTELIHKAYLQARLEVCPRGFDTLHYLNRKLVFIFPSTLVKDSKYFTRK